MGCNNQLCCYLLLGNKVLTQGLMMAFKRQKLRVFFLAIMRLTLYMKINLLSTGFTLRQLQQAQESNKVICNMALKVQEIAVTQQSSQMTFLYVQQTRVILIQLFAMRILLQTLQSLERIALLQTATV